MSRSDYDTPPCTEPVGEGQPPRTVDPGRGDVGTWITTTEARALSQSRFKNDIIRKVRACIEHDDMFEQRDSSSKKRLSFPEMSC